MHEYRRTARALTRRPRHAERQRHLQHPKSQRGTLGAEFKDSIEQKRVEVLRELVADHL